MLEVIYPVASVARLKAVIEEDRAKGTLDCRIQTVMRGFYASQPLPPDGATASGCAAIPIEQRELAPDPGTRAPLLIQRWQQDGRRVVPVDLALKGQSLPNGARASSMRPPSQCDLL